MKIHSCTNCGVMLDLDCITKTEIEDDDGVVDTDLAYWTGEKFLPRLVCPVCSHVFCEDGEVYD